MPLLEDSNPIPETASRRSLLAWLRPSARHTALSATLLMMTSTLLSAVLGLARTKYIAYVFGSADAYLAAFELPDMIGYFLIGGVASIPLITILNRYRQPAGQPNDEAAGDLALSHVLNSMLVILGMVTVVAEFLVPLYTRYKFPGFRDHPAEEALCNTLTRLILPAQLFFFAGGVLGSRLLVRKIFTYQALTPLIYNAGIIAGGVLLSKYIGIYSLAVGVLIGVILGPFGLNAYAALRGGMRYHLTFDLKHPAFREWLRLSLPLMAGVSLVTADKWILSYFASHDEGAITRLTYAKTLFTAPMGVIGQAAGAASLPFFAALFSQGKLTEFAESVNRSVSRIVAVSFLLAAGLLALAHPIVDLLFRGGKFQRVEAGETAAYFAIFTLSLFLWAAQAIYARAFYAAGNTLLPAIAGTIVTVCSLPVYAILFHLHGIRGLVFASDIGILTQTLTLAVLLQRRKMVDLSGLSYAEFARSAIAAAVSFAGVHLLLHYLPHRATHVGDAVQILCGGLVWLALTFAVLKISGSTLLGQLRHR